jgi:hypothetical protein
MFEAEPVVRVQRREVVEVRAAALFFGRAAVDPLDPGEGAPGAAHTFHSAGAPARPVTIVAHDPKVLDRISDWGWTDGLKPTDDAPVWRMDRFRNRFLTAYGPQNDAAPAPPASPAKP